MKNVLSSGFAVFALVFASANACAGDIAPLFSRPANWRQKAAAYHKHLRKDGFRFADETGRVLYAAANRSNVLWNGMNVYETKIMFGDVGFVERVEISLYNRGDDKSARGLSTEGLERILENVRSAMRNRTKSGEVEQVRRQGGYVYTQKFSGPSQNAELSWGVAAGSGAAKTVHFAKLTLLPPAAAAGAKQNSRMSSRQSRARSSANVKSNIVRNSRGDVWIKNIPMVDQGQKGYCAVATAERVLRYFGNNVDEHELAQMAGSTAMGGTSSDALVKTVRRICSNYSLGYEGFLDMAPGTMRSIEEETERYNKTAKRLHEKQIAPDAFRQSFYGASGNSISSKVLYEMRKRDYRRDKFVSAVHEHINEGVPIVWGVRIGYYREPDIPQAEGGHIRLIVGYNDKTEEILYSDSWGSRHVLKRMPLDWAFTMTRQMFALKPL